MRFGCAALLILGLTAPVGAQGDFTVDDVEKAVQRGAAWLEKAKLPSDRFRGTPRAAGSCGGYELGYEALACFALLRSGVDPKRLEPRFQRMRAVTFTHTYCVATYLLALEAKHVERIRVKKAKKAKVRRTQARVALFKRKIAGGGDVAEIFRAAKWLLAGKTGPGTWSYSSYARYKGSRLPGRVRRRRLRIFDNSNVQFAVYGLHAAAAAGFAVPDEIWKEIAEHFLKCQDSKGDKYPLDGVRFGKHAAPTSRKKRRGTKVRRKRTIAERRTPRTRGWTYTERGRAYASMTAAGLGCVAMAEERLLGRVPAARLAPLAFSKQDGIAWLVRSLIAGSSSSGHGHHYYYLWSLEKAFDATGVEEIERGRHWWRDGADWLLKQQKANGSWARGVADTAFALLFLNRGTLPMWEDGRRFGRVKTGAERVEAGPWDLVKLDDGTPLSITQTLIVLGKAGSAKTARETLKDARLALPAMGPGEQANVVGLLAPLVDSNHKGVRRFAKKALTDLLGSDDPEVAREFASAWRGLVMAARSGDQGQVGKAREVLEATESSPALRRRALRTLVELRAAEAVPVVIDQLLARDLGYRQFAWTMLYSLAGAQRPFDPVGTKRARLSQIKEWRAWWKVDGRSWERSELLRRDVLALAREATRDAARSRLLKRGQAAVPRLIAALEDERLRASAHDLLRRVTGQTHPAQPEAWRTWWRTQ